MSQTNMLRASGIPQLAGVPYKLLAGLDFVSYEESSPTENARKLNEREVDLALIPAVDYALHGGYVGLEFGTMRDVEQYLAQTVVTPIRTMEDLPQPDPENPPPSRPVSDVD